MSESAAENTRTHDGGDEDRLDLSLPDDFHVEHGPWDRAELIELLEAVRGPRARVLEVLRVADGSLPISSLEKHANLAKNTAKYHLQDAGTSLLDLGLVEKDGNRRVVSGNYASTWRLTDDGRAVAAAATTVPGIRGTGEDADLDPALESIDDRLDRVATQVDVLDDAVKAFGETDYVTQQQVTDHVREYTAAWREQARTASDRSERNRSTLDRLSENVDEFRRKADARERELTALDAKVDDLRDELEYVREIQGDLRDSVGAIEEWATQTGRKRGNRVPLPPWANRDG